MGLGLLVLRGLGVGVQGLGLRVSGRKLRVKGCQRPLTTASTSAVKVGSASWFEDSSPIVLAGYCSHTITVYIIGLL